MLPLASMPRCRQPESNRRRMFEGHPCFPRCTMAAMMAPPRVARGPDPCKGPVLLLDDGARIRRARETPDARRGGAAHPSRCSARERGRKSRRRQSGPARIRTPITRLQGVGAAVAPRARHVRRRSRTCTGLPTQRDSSPLPSRSASRTKKGPGARCTPRSVSGGIVLSVGFPTCTRGDSPFHPSRQERRDRSVILLGGGLVSVRLPGLSAARLATGRVSYGAGTFLSGRCGHRQPPTGSWTVIRTQQGNS